METVPIFDWLRWVEVPIWIAMVGWIIMHARHDAATEGALQKLIGIVETQQHVVTTILTSMLESKDE